MKIFGNSITLLIIGLAITGIYYPFLISEQMIVYFLLAGAVFSALILLLIGRFMLSNASKYRENMRARGKSPLTGMIATFILVPFMVIFSFYKGLPVGFNFIAGKPDKIIVTVLKKPSLYHSKHCFGGLYLSEYRNFTNDKICGIEESDWKTIQAGDKLELTGNGSIFGFSYKNYNKLPERH